MTFYTNVSSFGDKILLREFNPDLNKATKRKVDFNPSLFVPSNSPTGWKSVHGLDLKRVEFSGVKDFWDFKKRYNEMGQPLYGDISPMVQFIAEEYGAEIDAHYDKVRVQYLDIEVDHGDVFPDPLEALMPITAVSVYDNQTNTMYVYGLEYDGCPGWHPDRSVDVDWSTSGYLFKYRGYQNEKDLLLDFIKTWEKDTPDIITGWFSEGFDVPYIVNRIDRILGPDESKRLSPWKYIKVNEPRFNNQKTTYDIIGVAHLDYKNAYQKYSYTPQESYKLGHIAYAELGDQKLSYSEVKNLPELYRTNYQKFIDYNIKDVDIVHRLEQKKGFISLIISMAYYSGINFDEVASPIRIWDSLIYNHLRQKGIQIDPESRSSKSEKYEGAYVKDPVAGRYNWVVSIDLASEYPSLMRGINISPDTLDRNSDSIGSNAVEDILAKTLDLSFLKDVDHAMAANGTQYSRKEQGFMGVLLTKLFDGRKADKKVMLEAQNQAELATGEQKAALKHKAGIYHVRQYSKKVLLNSAYGALGNEFFRWFDLRLAEAVTLSGQVAIRWAEKNVNAYLNKVLETDGVDYVIYIDTDSIYLNVDPIVAKFMPGQTDKAKIVDKLDLFFAKKVSEVIKNAYQELYEYLNHREQLMFMDREVIADRAVFCSKKHYFMRVWDSEGVRYAQPKIKIMGMGFVKSNIPEFCRNQCKTKMVEIALDGTNAEFSAEIDRFEQVFNDKPLEEIAYATGVSNIRKYVTREGYKKGTPIGSKSAIVYNRLHKEKKLGPNHPLINDGDKIKFLCLKKINPINEETIGFVDFLPEEFGLHDHVDRQAMFEKAFISPVTEILTAMNWDRKMVSNLSSWFNM